MSSNRFLCLIAIFALNIVDMLFVIFTNGTILGIAKALYGELQTFLFGWMALWYLEYGKGKRANSLFAVVLGCYLITSITTFIGNINNPGASRLLATSLRVDDVEVYNKYVAENIGGFSFVYGAVLIVPLIIYLAKNKKINKIYATAIIVSIALGILASEYTTALLFFVVAMITAFLRKLTTKKLILVTVVLLIILIFASPLLALVFDFAADNISSSIVSSRFEYISKALKGEAFTEIDGASDRITLYKKAFNEILDSNFLGTWGRTSGSGHSIVIDTIVRYGIIGIAVLVFVYVNLYKFALKPYKNKEYYPYIWAVYWMSVGLAILNTSLNLFSIIFVIPLFSIVAENSEIGKNGALQNE